MIKMLELITTMLVTTIVVITILRWLFGKGKKYVRKQQVLEFYQKALLNANQLSARSKAAAEEAIVLEEAPVGAGGEVENPVNPLDILPAELWDAVLDQLTDWNDLKRCCDTCRLFRRLLEGTKNEWLFKGVFPIIQRHHENLEETQLLKCRQICKAWKEEVDNFPALRHPVYIHVSQDGRARTRQKWQDMINHGGSPFVGGNVEIEVRRGNGDLVEDLEGNPVDDVERAAAVEDIHYFINGLGKHITGICLSVTSHLNDASVLCHLLLGILSKCQRLKMLDIHDVMIFQSLDYLSEPEMDALTPQDFTLGPNFQSLAVGMLYGFWPIQNRILQHCAGQLKKLEAMEWTPNFEMLALEELKINLCLDSMWQATNGNVLVDLMQLRAPRLKRLSFPLNTVQCSLHNLLTLTKHFSTIEHLSLEWTENKVGFSKDQLLAVPEGLQPPPSLKTMQFPIISQFNDEMNADFLMFFPLLETLRLSRGNSGENTDKGFIVQLSSHWMQEDRVYESNVWELLPFLKMVMVSQDFFTFEDYDTTRDAMYSRKKYNDLKSNLAK